MTSVLAANLEVLQDRFPQAADLIRAAEDPLGRRAEVNERGITVYQAEGNAGWLNLNSAYDPWAEADRQTEKLPLAEAKLVFAIGEGGLYHLESILAQINKSGNMATKLLFVSNRPDYLRLILATRDVRTLLSDERFFLILDRSWDRLKEMVNHVVFADAYDIPPFTWFVHPVEENLQSSFCREFQSFLHLTYTTSLINLNTTSYFEQWWLHNFVCNIPYLLSAIPNQRLRGSWLGKPVIVVGAGPSLNKNIDLLAEAKGRALILCVDTAYRALAKQGIVPDLLVTLDGSPMNSEHMRETDYKNVPLLLDVYSHRDVLKQHGVRTPKIIVSSLGFHSIWWESILARKDRFNSLETGGSVGTAAVSFAREIGADPVILVGVDLSYPDGACYAQGTLHEAKTLAADGQGRSLYPVQDIQGKTVMTTYDYLYYLRWLHLKAKLKDRKYINATEGGAVREGFCIKSLREVLIEDCSELLPVEEWRGNLTPLPFDPEEMKRVAENVRRSHREMRAALRLLKIMIRASEEYLQELDEGSPVRTDCYIRRFSRGQLHLSGLSLAMPFLDAHSFKTIYTDVKLADSIQHNRSQHSDEEKLKLAARQTLNLLLGLRDVAATSLKMHLDALISIKSFEKEMAGCEHPESL